MGAPVGHRGPISLVPFEVDHDRGYFVVQERKAEEGSYGTPISPEYWEDVIREATNRIVIVVYAGNQHHSDFLFRPRPLFDFVGDATTELHHGAVVVPRRLVSAHFARTVAHLDSVLLRLKRAGCREIRVVGTPPPQSDLARLGVEPENEVLFTPAPILLRMWRVIQEVTEDVAHRGGATFVPVPPEAMDAGGFLGKDFYDPREMDITHGNRKYGDMMLKLALRETPL